MHSAYKGVFHCIATQPLTHTPEVADSGTVMNIADIDTTRGSFYADFNIYLYEDWQPPPEEDARHLRRHITVNDPMKTICGVGLERVPRGAALAAQLQLVEDRLGRAAEGGGACRARHTRARAREPSDTRAFRPTRARALRSGARESPRLALPRSRISGVRGGKRTFGRAG